MTKDNVTSLEKQRLLLLFMISWKAILFITVLLSTFKKASEVQLSLEREIPDSWPLLVQKHLLEVHLEVLLC